MADRENLGNTGSGSVDLAGVIEQLTGSIASEKLTRLGAAPVPMGAGAEGASGDGRTAADSNAHGLVQSDQARVREMVDLLRRLMFPGYFDPEPVAFAGGKGGGAGTSGAIDRAALRDHVAVLAARVGAHLLRLVEAVRRYARQDNGAVRSADWPRDVTSQFMSRLAPVRDLLSMDVMAAYEGDPAAEHTDEIIVCYPGLEAVFAQRIAHELYDLGVPILPRIISEQAHSRTGIDIHPGARIGRSFFVDHGSGVVIGETTVIGDRVKVYQGVTLGARSFPRDKDGRVIRGAKRHPTIGNDVTIYAGAVILGGDTVIGDGCVIAGGVFVTGSVPPGHVVQQSRPDLTLKPAPGTAAAKKGAASDKPAVDVGWLEGGAGI